MRPDHAATAPCLQHQPTTHTATFGRSLRAQCIAAANWIGRQLERRRSRLALLEMTDEQLKDIGLSRGEAHTEYMRRSWD
ncbi:DUF1127 domain-containing protein [Mesorhizobium sp. WSM4303]|uniref:DUF1127 domain-containing protein n=1 Tax=unclassified Mesorhizobium TaxID=325217 RepID=UPI00115D7622|nr:MULTISPECIES: DUF1127 domain-containing protein [unclassified Mesorhizobium]TRC98926.1 DUF1127 domain-containing protein [Mesorhizobium sp. WSM4306]TRD07025.1 DUF1127 domain-containing protein [Mesorhizobium sp. WSM4303]